MGLISRSYGVVSVVTVCGIFLLAAGAGWAGDWIELSTPDFRMWRGKPQTRWVVAKDAKLDPNNPRQLVLVPGTGVIASGVGKRGGNLYSKEKFGDIELHLEFMIPARSNSGVKFHGHYEIQIRDSWKAKNLTGADCGGIYPRAEYKPRYHHIDKGIPPKVNAALPPGQWQTLDAVFLAPRFDGKGKKIANARLVRVVLNGKVIHENVELKWPTGHLWSRSKEVARGPLMLQGDHGPVAFRNVKVRPIESGRSKN